MHGCSRQDGASNQEVPVTESSNSPTPPTWPSPGPDTIIVVGVDVDQRPDVVLEAAGVAARMGAGLVCAWVDSTQVVYGASLDGTRLITPLDPDLATGSSEVLKEQVHRQIADALAGVNVPWRLEQTVGDIASGLTEVAQQWDALMIAIGGRRPGFSGWMNEVIGGSIAGHLVHTQHRAVLVIPGTKDR
nr:universal stress protein [Ornithinimicrobium cryptoxanthini]